MKRYFYVSDNLNDLEAAEIALKEKGIDTAQIHILSEDDAEVEKRHLHAVDSLSKRDTIRSGVTGLIIGLICSIAILLLSYYFELHKTITWVPPIFLAVVILGFCTWEGGFLGIQRRNRQFAKFEQQLKEGKHVFFVDVSPEQETLLNQVVSAYPSMALAGAGDASPEWIIGTQVRLEKFVRWAP
jgi:hypothetical protein